MTKKKEDLINNMHLNDLIEHIDDEKFQIMNLSLSLIVIVSWILP